MNYKSIRLGVVVRLFFIFLSLAFLHVLARKGGYWISISSLGILIVAQIWWLLIYIEYTHRELDNFFEAVLSGDFTYRVSHKDRSQTVLKLHQKMEGIQERFKSLRHKNEELVHFYSLLLEKVPVAILIVQGEKISLANSAAQKLFQRNRLDHIDYLTQFGSQLALDVEQIMPGEQRTSQIVLHKATTSVSISAAAIQLSDGIKKIVSLNPIQRELDKQEMVAWQNLVQVFTHEIMNSMTPVASLSKTAAGLLKSVEVTPDSEQAEILDDARRAIDAVARRADNLMGFVQAYRRIADPPVINRSTINLQTMFSEVFELFKHQSSDKKVTLASKVTPENLELNADPIQIQQVLINLVKNSFESLESQQCAVISLHGYIGSGGNVIVDAIDNGSGIASDKLEQVFVPFYTSKREGTGIGLFLVKQIMQAHMGSAYATQAERGGTLVRLIF